MSALAALTLVVRQILGKPCSSYLSQCQEVSKSIGCKLRRYRCGIKRGTALLRLEEHHSMSNSLVMTLLTRESRIVLVNFLENKSLISDAIQKASSMS